MIKRWNEEDECMSVLTPLPGKVREAVTENEDMSHTVFIDAGLSSEAQIEAYAHALRHIRRGDFQSGNADAAEAGARDIVK